ncbi:MAG TPA: hypothetical protein VIF83_00585 [Gemmatimonadaceae bacterium]|jgi:hypothetical protein
MKRLALKAGVAAILLTAVACMETTGPSDSLLTLSNAFLTLPAGFTSTTNSFASDGSSSTAFFPRFDGGGRGRGPGGHGPGGGLMGGLGLEFFGGIGFGRGFGHGPFGGGPLSDDCTYSSSTGVVTCSSTRNGLTITRTFAFTNSAGTAQSSPDSTTNKVVTHSDVSGTVTRRDSSVSTVHHVSDQTVTGLAVGSTQRTVNGASRGDESTTGNSSSGAFTAVRAVGDSIRGLVIPLENGRPTYPTAGTVIRQMKVTVTIAGQATTKERREVITYDGSNTATLVIMQDGTTKTCKLPLPRGIPSCS